MSGITDEKNGPTAKEAEVTLKTAGQRRVNLIWEFTQAFIAICVTAAMIYCDVYRIESETLRYAFFLIIGFYFSRTNHQAIGGIKNIPYEGR